MESDAGKVLKDGCGHSFLDLNKDEQGNAVKYSSFNSGSNNSKGKFTLGSDLISDIIPIELVVDPTNMLVLTSIKHHTNSEFTFRFNLCFSGHKGNRKGKKG